MMMMMEVVVVMMILILMVFLLRKGIALARAMKLSTKSQRGSSVWSSTQVLFYFIFLVVPPRTLVPLPRIEPAPHAVEAWSLNHWTTREVPQYTDSRLKQTSDQISAPPIISWVNF